jgi:hypothetical protein
MEINSQGVSETLPWNGGYGTMVVAGDFDSNQVTIEADYGVGEWITQRDLGGDPIIIEESSAPNFLTAKCRIRLRVDGGGAAPVLKYSLRVLPVQVEQRY